MSDLQPKGVPVTFLDGVERHFLFTLAAVDDVQDHYGEAVGKVMTRISDEMEGYGVLAYLAMVLANDEIRRSTGKTDDDYLTEQQVKEMIDVPLAGKVLRAIFKSFGHALPESDDDDDESE